VIYIVLLLRGRKEREGKEKGGKWKGMEREGRKGRAPIISRTPIFGFLDRHAWVARRSVNLLTN